MLVLLINQKSYFGQFEGVELNGGVGAVHDLLVVLVVGPAGLAWFFLVDGGEEIALPLILLVVLLPLEQFPLDLDHLPLQEIDELGMLGVLLLLLGVERPLLGLLRGLLQLLQLPLLLGEDVVVVLVLELELVELLDAVLDHRLLLPDPLL